MNGRERVDGAASSRVLMDERDRQIARDDFRVGELVAEGPFHPVERDVIRRVHGCLVLADRERGGFAVALLSLACSFLSSGRGGQTASSVPVVAGLLAARPGRVRPAGAPGMAQP